LAEVELVQEGVALVDSGPLSATIKVWRDGHPLSDIARDGAQYALKILEQLAKFLPVIKTNTSMLATSSHYPEVVNEMISATQTIGDTDLTPLAAVAGATSDLVADYLLDTDATKIIVDNGGDIAVRLKKGEIAEVGLCLDLVRREIDYFIPVDNSCGICTSGFGGRSFTLGIANSVVVMASRASLADAAATYLGNRTTVDSRNVRRELAARIDPDTDIPAKEVTVSVGHLSAAEIQEALKKGQDETLRLIDKGIIHGAILSVKDNILPLGVFAHKMRRY